MILGRRLNFVSENLVNICDVFEKFGQHIWGMRKWPDMITHIIKVNELPPQAHDSLSQSDSSQNESRNRKVEAEFPKFVTTYDEACRIIEKYENSSTSMFVLCKEFGNEGEIGIVYILGSRIS